MGDYELDYTSLDMTGVARDWMVEALLVQQYEIVYEQDSDGTRNGTPARLLAATPIPRAVAWEDERRFVTELSDRRSVDFYYAVDLQPAR